MRTGALAHTTSHAPRPRHSSAARAYEVYENEYANDVLPGGRGDDDLPNLPYAVDANRYSDGVSSVSPLTDTAPAFPLHRGAVSDAPAGRRRLALAKVQSEIEQGVAAAGDGEYVRERRVAETRAPRREPRRRAGHELLGQRVAAVEPVGLRDPVERDV